MKKKKNLHLMCLAIAMACSFILISCGKDDPVSEGPTPPTEPTTPTEPTEPVVTYVGKVFAFTFLTPESGETEAFHKFIINSVKAVLPDLKKINDSTYAIGTKYLSTDTESSEAFEKQIKICKNIIFHFNNNYQNDIDNVPIYIGIMHVNSIKKTNADKDWGWQSINVEDEKGGTDVPVKTI